MKKFIYAVVHTLIFIIIPGLSGTLYSQKDTLHIYYQGLQTSVLDSNDAKIGKWAKSLKGRHVDVEIYTYFDNTDFKKSMNERAENLQLVVIRKARDFITVTSTGAVKGKKSQRFVADIVYTSDGSNVQPAAVNNENKKDDAGSTTTFTQTAGGEKKSEGKQPADKKNKEQKSGTSDKYEYVTDSIYVNGVLKVTKRKIKKN